MRAFLSLTKPRISLLFAFSGLTALLLQGDLHQDPLRLWIIVFSIFLVGGGANGFNQYFERDVDARMQRTAKKRPLPLGLIAPRSALMFSASIGIIGCVLLWQYGTWLAAAIGAGTIGFYSFYYTLWLKPRTPYNIVIGGIAGATAPLIGWAAATGHIGAPAWVIFALIVMWTPPHFWALALCCKQDYENVGYPMLPLVAGDDQTRWQILLYSLTLLPISLLLNAAHPTGMVYTISAIILGIAFLGLAWRLYRLKSTRSGWQLFAYSIFYLLLLLSAMIVDTFLR